MQTRLTVWDATTLLAKKAGISPQQAKAILQAQAELAYEHAGEGYPIPGLGVFSKVEVPASKMIMPIGPKKGEEVTVRAKQILKFRMAAAAREIAFRNDSVVPDITSIDLTPDDGPKE